MNLNIDEWKSFKVKKIFIIKNGKGITKEEIEDNIGTFAVVQSGEENNGVIGKINLDYCRKMQYTFSTKPCLTVARTGAAGFVSFQYKGCVVGDSAKILLLDDELATTEHYLFLQSILTANKFKYTYGRKVTEEKYMNDFISLPIKRDYNGKPYIDINKKYSDKGYIPDWKFMEDYIKSLHYKCLTTKNKFIQAPILNINNWKEFHLNKLMKISIAKSADIGNLENGTTPFLGRTNLNNGIQGYVDAKYITKGKCITLSMVGTNVALWQEKDFQASQNIAILRQKKLNKYIALFLCSILNFEIKNKYSYGRTIGKTNLTRIILKLPCKCNPDGTIFIDHTCTYSKKGFIPDWKFMEDYIKTLPYGDRL